MSGEFNEIDLTASYGFGSDAVSAEVGFIEYLFPNTAFAGTRELYLSLGFDVAASPSVSVYYDIDEVQDFYANVGVSFGGDVSDALAWSVDVSAGFAGDDFAAAYGGVSGGMYDGNVTFGLSGGRLVGVRQLRRRTGRRRAARAAGRLPRRNRLLVLAAREPRRPLLHERGDALLVVVRLAATNVRDGLAVEDGPEVRGDREVHVLLHPAIAHHRTMSEP